jgi:DNA-binding protein Fis
VFKEDTEYIEEIIFNRTRVGGRDNNLYRITSIANCVIGQNEIYQFKNLKEVQNNSKYTYCLFNKDGKLIEKCLVNKVKKYIYYRYIDNNNDDVEKIYTISRLSDKELYEKGSDYILKNGSWTSNLISIKKKKTRKELITRFKIFGAAIVLVAGCKFVKENNKYKKTISGQSIESVIDEILEMTSDDIYTLENYIKTEKLIDEYNLPNVEEFDLNETEKQREKTKNNL